MRSILACRFGKRFPGINRMSFSVATARISLVLLALISLAGCWTSSAREVVVYCALDREFSEPILQQFEQETGIRVLPKYDVESTKTVGLVSAIIQERQRPRCDVFWNNEILHTMRLEKMGLLAESPAIASVDWPASYRPANQHWIGFAARARVLIVNTKLVPAAANPSSIENLADEKWSGKVGIAKPLFGTTATHAAVLFAHWGDDRAKAFFAKVKKNASVLSGNKQVAEAVARGDLAFGVTDTDDAIIERDAGRPVEIIFPDQNGMGTLFIPNTLCAIQGSAHPREAQQFISFLLRADVERRLAQGPSAQFPVNPKISELPRVAAKIPVKWMTVDFAAAADSWDSAATFLRSQFASADED